MACPLSKVLVFCEPVGRFDLLFWVHFVGYYGKLEPNFTAGIRITSQQIKELNIKKDFVNVSVKTLITNTCFISNWRTV